MREAADLVRRLRASRLVTLFIGLGLLVACAVQLKTTHARLRDAKKELDWTRARLDEKRDIVRRQQNELAQLAAGVDRVARVGTDARERAGRLRRLARLEESREPETSPVEQIAVLDSGAPLVSETTAQALEELALLEGQTIAVHDSVVLLSALVEHGAAGRRHAAVVVAGVRCDLVRVRQPRLALRRRLGVPSRARHPRQRGHAGRRDRRRHRDVRRLDARLRQHGGDRSRLRPEDGLRPPLRHLRRRRPPGP